MKDVIKLLDWFNPNVTLETIKKSVVVYSNEKLMNCFEVFNPSLTVEQLRTIIKEVANMNFNQNNKPTTKVEKNKGKSKFTTEMDNIIKKEHGRKKNKEIAEIIKKKTGIEIQANKISQRAFYIKNKK